MKRLLILTLFSSTMTFGQLTDQDLAKIDSLRQVISTTKEDSIKVKAYAKWDIIVYKSDPQLDAILVHKMDSLCDKNLKGRLSSSERKFFELRKAWIHWSYGILERDQRNYQKSTGHYKSAAKIYKKYDNSSRYSRVVHAAGLNFYHQNELDSAMVYFNQSWEVKKEIDYYKGLGYTYMDIGSVYAKRKTYDQALNYLNQSLAVYDSLKLPDEKKDVFHRIGEVYLDQRDFKKASNYLEKALEIEERLQDVRGLKATYVSLSNLNYSMGNTEKGKRFRDLAVSVYTQLSDSIGLFSLYFDNGKRLVEHGNYSLANEYLTQAQVVAQELNSPKLEAKAHWYLGWSNSQMGHYEESLTNFGSSYDLRKKLKDKFAQASALMKMAQSHRFLEHKELAMKLSQKAIELVSAEKTSRQKA